MMTAVVDTDPASAPGVRAGAFGNATHLVCRECGAREALGPFYVCTECFGPLEVGYEFPAITRERIEAGPRSIWRYAPLLPVPADIATFRSTDPGFTRLVDARTLADDLGLKQLWIKDDSGNPTHSFKDRVVAVALSAARELGLEVLACPSTGNLANAVAAAAARAGIKSVAVGTAQSRKAKDLGLRDL
jgi:threonine synthase